jgi:hypothetical protein
MRDGIASSPLLAKLGWYLLTILLGLLFPVVAFGQGVSVQVKVSSQEAYLGETLVCQIVVEGGKATKTPEFPRKAGLNIEFEGAQDASMNMTSQVNGRVTRKKTLRFIYQYKVTITSPTVRSIPSAKVSVNKKQYQSQEIPLKIRIPRETDDFKLRMNPQKASLFVGEPVVVTVRLYLKKNVKGFEFSAPKKSAFERHNPPIEKLSHTQAQKQGLVRLKIFDSEVLAQQENSKLGGQTYTVIRFEQILVPKKAGRLKFGPITIQLQAVVGQRKRDFFSDPFGSPDIVKKFVIPSNTLEFDVKGLAEAPITFNGLIGRCQIQAIADRQQVRVGDPIELTVRVKSEPPLGRIEMPDLSKQSWAKQFKISRPDSPALINNKWKTQKWVLRARNEKCRAIPPIILTYFDTAAGKYKNAKSTPLPLRVQASRKVTVSPGTKEEPTVEKQKLSGRTKGILHNYQDKSVLTSSGTHFGDSVSLWQLFIALGPLLIFALIRLNDWLAGNNYFRRVSAERAAAFQGACRLIEEVQQAELHQRAEKTSLAFRQYIGAISRRSSEAMSSNDAVAEISKFSTESAAHLREVLATCDGIRFGHLDSDSGSLSKGAELLTRIHKDMLK